MISNRLRVVLAAAVLSMAAAPTACAAPARPAAPDGVRLLGERTLPWGTTFQGTAVGGLSGLDFDPRTGQWVFISDDRSEKNPARFYTADVEIEPDGIDAWNLTGTHPFRRPDGATYPPISAADGTTVDPEEIRFDPWSHDLWWTSEGERDQQLIDPSIRSAAPGGAFRAELPLPPNLAVEPDAGPRRNESLESLTFAAGGSLVVNAVESALLQDGDPPTTEHGALSRITVQDRGGRVLSQHAYPIDPVFAESDGEPGDNGIAAVLAAGDDRYLVLERAYVEGVGNSIRIYEADLRGSDDVKDVPSLRDAPVRPVHKRLLADLGRFEPGTVDNVEGITWGPRLPTGERTLALVSDNNFSPAQTTRLIVLALR
ncbi:esterase-like activity of phytase family protein [Saccharopolyspora gloriosae]|uniref:esterase-like activity of phytase family protein n=1 Tax=Saccharopolyspora gloriosae TaxID=455344 RepID=UPI001FB69B62|nr:esterase-like activity of phytase family protein [Saccharopolyspora gloriosae]